MEQYIGDDPEQVECFLHLISLDSHLETAILVVPGLLRELFFARDHQVFFSRTHPVSASVAC